MNGCFFCPGGRGAFLPRTVRPDRSRASAAQDSGAQCHGQRGLSVPGSLARRTGRRSRMPCPRPWSSPASWSLFRPLPWRSTHVNVDCRKPDAPSFLTSSGRYTLMGVMSHAYSLGGPSHSAAACRRNALFYLAAESEADRNCYGECRRFVGYRSGITAHR